jgi:glycosyltransferase involved in cell wall biosynthesis
LRLAILTKRTGWYGRHSGYYEQLPAYLQRLVPGVAIVQPRRGWSARAAGKMIALWRGLPPRDQSLTLAETVFRWRFNPGRGVGHLLCVEDHLPLLFQWQKCPASLVATLHFPPGKLAAEAQTALRRLSSAIVLYQRDIDWFERLVGKGRVRFVRHGVDLEFFCPAARQDETLRVVYAGQFERNTAMFSRVLPVLMERFPELLIDIVVAAHGARDPYLAPLLQRPRVCLHTGVTDEKLRSLYRNARCMLLPMQASGANNAIVEALACGLPVVTTDVGGIRDYGGGTIFPVVPNDDDDAFIDLASTYLNNNLLRDDHSRLARQFAEKYLSWLATAEHHLAAYGNLCGN